MGNEFPNRNILERFILSWKHGTKRNKFFMAGWLLMIGVSAVVVPELLIAFLLGGFVSWGYTKHGERIQTAKILGNLEDRSPITHD